MQQSDQGQAKDEQLLDSRELIPYTAKDEVGSQTRDFISSLSTGADNFGEQLANTLIDLQRKSATIDSIQVFQQKIKKFIKGA
jgi:flagellar motor switch protein FliM